MASDEAFIWDKPTPELRPQKQQRPTPDSSGEDRITLRDAESRFGVRASTLRGWSRRGVIDAELMEGPHGEQWMVVPESIAHHLSRNKPNVSTASGETPVGGVSADGGSMLVPRDAWDKLMDQLGNLHEAGLQLAEARERAAKAETEATFLRERLSEIRSERDQLRDSRGDPERPKRRWWRRG